MTTVNVFSRIKRSVAELGAVNALLYYVGEALGRFSGRHVYLRRYLIVAQPIPDSPLIKRAAMATAVSQVCADDPATTGFPRPTDVIRARYAAGHTCLQITVDGAFAGFLWLAFGAYEEDEVRCRYLLADQSRLVWDFDVYIEPRYRIGRSFARLWDATNDLLRNRGIEWSLSRISAFNASSLAAHARLGTVPLGYATFLCIGPLQLAFLPENRMPRLSWNDASRPVMVLGPPRQR